MLKHGRVNLKNILLVFMVIQPFLDSFVLYSDKIINMVGFSPTTILRFSLIGLIFIYLFFNKVKKKENKYIFIYGIIVLLYTIIHHFVCSVDYSGILYKTFNYSLIGEIFYLARLIYPFLLAYIIYLMKLTKKEFKFVIQGTTIIITLILIILNLLEISQTSYFEKYITNNMFSWGDTNISRYLLAGKGWFNSANQIGGLILLLLPLNFYYANYNGNKWDITILILLILSSYSIGTRISCIGFSLVLLVLYLMLYIYKGYKKEKTLKKDIFCTILIIGISMLIFNYAPIVNLSGNNILNLFNLDNVVSDTSNEELIILNPDYDGSDICEFLKKTSTTTEYYEELYPCHDNIPFWKDYITNRYYKDANNRLMEKLIFNDVYSKVSNLSINLFGMSRSRFESAKIYLERDIIVHYYTLGIFGIAIFILPYFLICGFIGLKKLIHNNLDFFDVCLIISILLPLVVSILTGHIIDELIVTLYIGFSLGYLLYINQINKDKNILEKKNTDNRKKVLFVVDENRMGGVSTMLEDMLKYLDRSKHKISILVLHDVDKYFKNIDSDIEVIYGTKFFNVIDYNLKDLIKEKRLLLIIKKIYLVLLMKSGLIKYKIIKERNKILSFDYDVEIAFKDGFTAIFTAYGNSKKKIHWLHYEYKKYNSNGNYPRLFNKILPTFDKIVAVSETVMNDFNDIYHLQNKTIVINNIIDTNKIIDKSKEKVDRTLNKNKLNIVCVGRLHSCKGFDRLIKAISKLSKKEQENINVEIYGDGLEKNHLEKLIHDNKLEKTIHLKGRVDNPYKYLKGNDLFILSSHFETFGVVIVEAMTLGVPVFALRNANTDKIIDNNVNGYITPNTDKDLYKGLKYLISNRKLINKYKKNLLNYSYNNEKIIKEIENLIN